MGDWSTEQKDAIQRDVAAGKVAVCPNCAASLHHMQPKVELNEGIKDHLMICTPCNKRFTFHDPKPKASRRS
jgi:5-methylcytosine-specific restriction endonuclease McrA